MYDIPENLIPVQRPSLFNPSAFRRKIRNRAKIKRRAHGSVKSTFAKGARRRGFASFRLIYEAPAKFYRAAILLPLFARFCKSSALIEGLAFFFPLRPFFFLGAQHLRGDAKHIPADPGRRIDTRRKCYIRARPGLNFTIEAECTFFSDIKDNERRKEASAIWRSAYPAKTTSAARIGRHFWMADKLRRFPRPDSRRIEMEK